MRAALAGLVVVAATRAAAADPAIAAVAAAADARSSVLVGPSGQVYDPDGRGSWIRHRAGGVGDAVGVAVIAGDAVIAGAADATAAHGPPFQWQGDAWHAVPLALRAHAVVGRGTRAAVAVNRAVWTLDGAAKPLPDAPAAVTMLGASAGGVAIATAAGVFRLDGKRWKPVDHAPAVTSLLDDRWAVTGKGLFDLHTGKAIEWPPTFAASPVFAVDAAGDFLIAAAGAHGVEVASLAAGKLVVEVVPDRVFAAPFAPIAGVAIDRAGRIVVALRDGRVAFRTGTAWSATTARDDLPAPRAGSPPATSR